MDAPSPKVSPQVKPQKRRMKRLFQFFGFVLLPLVLACMLAVIFAAGLRWKATDQSLSPSAPSSSPQPSSSDRKKQIDADIDALEAADTKSAPKPDLKKRIDNDIDILVAAETAEARKQDPEKEINEGIDRRIRYDQSLIDKIVLLVGIYTTILSVMALAGVVINRQDARQQVELARKEIDKLDQLTDELFPELGHLHSRIIEIMQKMKMILPDEANWRDDESYRRLTEAERQSVLVSESTVAALNVFGLERSPRHREAASSIYRAMARFYFGRHNTSHDHDESDYERANYYATRSIELEPDNSGAYRLRGAIALGRYYGIRNHAGARLRAKQLLDSAELDLFAAISKDTNDYIDAGAHYNQANVRYYRNDLEGAVKQLLRVIELKGKISHMHRQKYLPDVYVNLGCFLALQARQAHDRGKDDQELSRRAVQSFRDGKAEFGKTAQMDTGLEAIYAGIERELKGGADLSSLDDVWKYELRTLLPSTRESDGTPKTS